MTVAHAGHWALQLIYVFPVLFIIGFIVFDRLKRRRREADDADVDAP